MIQVQRRDEKETSESVIRRFSRRVQQSRILVKKRKDRYRTKKATRGQKRHNALYKVRIRKEIDHLKKFGRFDAESLKEVKKRISKDF